MEDFFVRLNLAARPEWSSFLFCGAWRAEIKKAGTEGGYCCPNYYSVLKLIFLVSAERELI